MSKYIQTPGIYQISNDEYHADPCIEPSLSRGIIKSLLAECAYKTWFEHPRLNPACVPKEDKHIFDVGSAGHALFLEGLDKISIINFEDWRTKAAKELRDEARLQGKYPLLTKEADNILLMISAAKWQLADSELAIQNIRAEGEAEQSFFWKEGNTWFRIRPDWTNKDKTIILDYKTTALSVNPEYLTRKIINEGLDIQAALYCRGVKAICGVEPKFVFLFQNVQAPYLCSFVSMTPDFMHMGRQKVSHGIGLWEQCMSTGDWPKYSNRIAYLDCPAWATTWQMSATMIGSDEEGI